MSKHLQISCLIWSSHQPLKAGCIFLFVNYRKMQTCQNTEGEKKKITGLFRIYSVSVNTLVYFLISLDFLWVWKVAVISLHVLFLPNIASCVDFKTVVGVLTIRACVYRFIHSFDQAVTPKVLPLWWLRTKRTVSAVTVMQFTNSFLYFWAFDCFWLLITMKISQESLCA